MSGNPQRWIQSNVNAIIANSPLTPVFKKYPGLDKVFRDNYERLKPFLQEKRVQNSIVSNPNGIINVLKSHGLKIPKTLENITPAESVASAPAPAGENASLATEPKYTPAGIKSRVPSNGDPIYIQGSSNEDRTVYKVIKTGDKITFYKLTDDSKWATIENADEPTRGLFTIINCPKPQSMSGGARKSRRQRKQKRRVTHRKQRKQRK
jgi:hypothetical protein